MATTIVTKNSSTASAVPTAAQLVQGELAVNVADKRLYTENNAGAIVELGTNPSTLTVAGEITANGGIALGDGDKATFGAGDDLQIYHDTHSYIQDTGTGSLFLLTQGAEISLFGNTSAEYMGRFIQDGAVELYHNGSQKLATTATGIDVTGSVTADSLATDDDVSGITTLGRYSSGFAYSLVRPTATATGIEIRTNAGNALAHFLNDGTTKLHHNGSTKLATTATGIDVTGTATMDGLVVDGAGDGVKATIGKTGGTNLNIYADTNTVYLAGSSALSTAYIIDQTNNNMQFKVNAAERMRISSAGNVGIGTSTPSYNAKLDVNGIIRADVGSGGLSLSGYAAPDMGYFSYNYTNSNGTEVVPQSIRASHRISMGNGALNAITFDYRAAYAAAGTWSERMRIDSSGNLLVGKSSLGIGVTGTEVRAGGQLLVTADNDNPADFNRKTSDGVIALFRKDGTTVGSIGYGGGGILYNAASNYGLKFYDAGANIIHPATTAGGDLNGSVDLGYAGSRFKDLYLSGGVYLGGTGAANKLDDYEEGTFNVELWAGGTQLALSEYGGSYVKIGNLVTINFEADCSNTNGASGSLEVRGMPFTVADVISPTGIEANGSVSYWQNWTTAINSPSVYAEGATTTLYVMGSTSSTTASNTNLTAANIGTGEFRGSVTYRTA